MNILITGGAGFIASHIVDEYINLGHRVIVIDNLSTGKIDFLNKKAIFHKADIRSKKEIEIIIQKEKPEVINHHAAQISVRNSVDDPINDAEINLKGLLNILESAKYYHLKKIIFASSGGVVYGDAKIIPTPENYLPLNPISPYGITKLASEYYLQFYQNNYKIPYVVLRYSNVYGPRQNPHGEAGVVAIFSKKLLRNEQPTINGDGKQTRDYVFVGDVVKANTYALKESIVGTYNIGTGQETDVNSIYIKIKKVVGTNTKALYGVPKSGEQKRSCLDIAKANNTLDWIPEITLDQGIVNTVEYFRKNE